MATDRDQRPAGRSLQGGGEPSRTEIRQRVNNLYARAESDTGNFNFTRVMNAGTRQGAPRPSGGGRSQTDPALDAVTKQWFDVARSALGPTVPAQLPRDRMPDRSAQARPAKSPERGELPAVERRVPELAAPARAIAALPAAPEPPREAPKALLPAADTAPAGQPSPMAGEEQFRQQLASAGDPLSPYAAQQTGTLPAIEAAPTAAPWDTTQQAPVPTGDSWLALPSDTGTGVAVPAETGYLSSTALSADTGYLTTAATPADAGYLTAVPPAVDTSHLAPAAPAADTGYLTSAAPPADTGYLMTTPTPADTGYLTAMAPAADTGYLTTAAPPADTGYLTTTPTPADTGYLTAMAPAADTSYLTTAAPPADTSYLTTAATPVQASGFATPGVSDVPAGFVAPAPSVGDSLAPYPEPLSKGERALAFARAQIGRPCVWGAMGPGSYDCSSLTQASWKAAGVSLPRAAIDQARAGGTVVPLADAQPGDLVFYHDDLSHVGLYAGNGMVIHAPSPGAYIREESIFHAGESAIKGAVRPA